MRRKQIKKQWITSVKSKFERCEVRSPEGRFGVSWTNDKVLIEGNRYKHGCSKYCTWKFNQNLTLTYTQTTIGMSRLGRTKALLLTLMTRGFAFRKIFFYQGRDYTCNYTWRLQWWFGCMFLWDQPASEALNNLQLRHMSSGGVCIASICVAASLLPPSCVGWRGSWYNETMWLYR